MTRPRLRLRAERRLWADTIALLVVAERAGGKFSAADPLIFRDIEEGAIVERETVSLRMGEAQELIDELWRCGLRPTEGTGSAGSLAATERHLKDMQKISFDLLARLKP